MDGEIAEEDSEVEYVDICRGPELPGQIPALFLPRRWRSHIRGPNICKGRNHPLAFAAFRPLQFLEALKQRGVDTSKVQETKAEAALWGIEHLAKAKSWPSQVATRGKKRISGMFHHKPASKDDGKGAKGEVQHIVDDVGAWKKEVLYGRKGSRNQSETNEKERAEAEKDSQQQTVGKDVVQEGEGQRSREGGGPSDREGQDKEEDHKGEKEQEQEERQEDAYPRKDTDGIRGEREEKKEKEPLAGQQEDTPGSGQGPA
ncbi:hypothetical protein OE88DRAFT_82705 [Heliocybe sulcata]|uniref:Uncharacterized protein n=1 Tax=Heliocybe sulcata TaxID=5364 RepID=A0A5C3NHZ1_9AGAM|nr:hypothetical protein OE88DRAFT_82705 [Heliocybe sulcata]